MIGRIRERLRCFLRAESGAQLAEIAIVLPILLLLVASIAEFGRFFHTYTTLSKATRNGARYLSSQTAPGTRLSETKNMVVCGRTTACASGEAVVTGLTVSNVDVALSGVGPDKITVSITGYTFQPVFNLAGLTGVDGLSLNVAVNSSTTMKYLVAPL